MASIDLVVEIGSRDADGSYPIFSHWRGPRDITQPHVMAKAKFDFGNLASDGLEPDEYGQLLTDGLFYDKRTVANYQKARGAAEDLEADIRFRIAIDSEAAELHALRWETLRDPIPPHDCLTTRERIHFSRYLLSERDWWSGRPRARQDLRALVAVADPVDLDRKRFPAVNAEQWHAMIRESLGKDIRVDKLGTPEKPATFDAIAGALGQASYDILVLVAHGFLEHGSPWLWLENTLAADHGDGWQGAQASGIELAERIDAIGDQPRLVVLCSCESAGSGRLRGGDWDMLAALGPRLAAGGVPAVVAMQGLIPMNMAHKFLKKFFEKIQFDGQVDGAIAAARLEQRSDPRFWMPALFLRLESGNLRWYTRGFLVDDSFKRWKALIDAIIDRQCTPILGLGLHEPVFGPLRRLAREWAEDTKHRFPMASHMADDLHHVAQYLAVTQEPETPRKGLMRYLCETIIKLHKGALTPEFIARYDPLDAVPKELLGDLMVKVWETRRATVSDDAHDILARLPFPVYVTANPDNLMFEALRNAKTLKGRPKKPHRAPLRWPEPAQPAVPGLRLATAVELGEDKDNVHIPSEVEPLVFHVLGSLERWEDVPVTEDDYFELLIQFGANKSRFHREIQGALAMNSLLFLGFQLDEWSFRVLLHALRLYITQRASRGIRVAVQINPEEGRIRDAAGAHKYLEQYLESKNIFVYWGSAEDFLGELWEQWPGKGSAGGGE
jgi:CHAT domain/SIR2-like domain